MHALLSWARAYTQAQLTVIPCERRSKRPRLRQWKPYQEQSPTALDLVRWFGPWSSTDAVAIVTGRVSGGLEVLDFDAPELFPAWAERLQRRHADLLQALPVVRTPSGGYHVYFRSAGPTAGNQKLAVDPAKPRGKYTLIETRGEGGYVLAPPSAGYEMQQGRLTALPLLEAPERTLLLDTARAFSRQPVVTSPRPRSAPRSLLGAGSRPGDDYNRRGDVTTILERHGWRCVRYFQETSYWRRPGKRWGHSATYNYRASRYFYVFTSNAPPFAPDRAYSPFAVFTLLEHGGDYRTAAVTLRRLGYGAST
jgi:hypothetical protein